MNNVLQMYYKKFFLVFAFLLFAACLIFFFGSLLRQTHYDTESMLQFIVQPKDIEIRDFSNIVEQMRPKPLQKEENIAIIQQTNVEKSHSQPTLTLHAILNQNALINTTWLKINESLTYDNKIYILQRITKHGVYLKSKDTVDEVIYLEILSMPKGLLLDAH